MDEDGALTAAFSVVYTWRDTVAEMRAEPRGSVKYDNVFPDNEGWG